MTTSIFSVAPDNTSDTTFRAWGSALSTALTTVGLVKTADTGQINWTTVLKPAGATTFPGFEMWRLGDALHATQPIYIRIGYGSGTTAALPGLQIQCGKGTNGAGTLTGALTASTNVACSNSNVAASSWYVSSGDGSMLAISPAPALLTNTTCLVVVERSRAADGTPTGTGMIQVTRAGASSVLPNTSVRNYTTGTGLDFGFWPAAVPANTASAVSVIGAATKAPMFPAVVADNQGNLWQPRSLLVYASLDVSALTAVTVDGWNTYLALGMAGTQMGAAVGSNAYGQAAIGWW